MAGIIDNFERFWNSSFGLPQQALFRLLRVVQDPNVDFFDEEGFGDGALVPLLGMFDADRKDVRPDEMVGRINKLTGLEMDEDSFLAQFGVGVATDPLSFMGSSATTAAKAAQRLGRAADTPAVRALRKAGDAPQLTAGRLGEHIETALSSAATPAKQRKLLRQGQAALEGIEDKGALVSNLRKESVARELKVGLPILVDFNKGTRAVAPGYDSWFKFLGSQIPGREVVGKALNDYGAKIPVVRSALRSMTDIREGFKGGAQARSKLTGGDVAQDFDPTLAGKQANDFYDRVTKKRAELIAAADDTPEDLIRAMFGTGKVDQNMLQTMLGVDDLNTLTRQDIQDFASRFEHNQTLFDPVERKLTGAGRAVKATRSFKFGAATKRAITLGFKTDAGIEELAEVQGDLMNTRAAVSEQLEQMTEEGFRLLRDDAAREGMDPNHLGSMYTAYLQFAGHTDDIAAIQHITRSNPEEAAAFGKSLLDYGAVMTSSAKTFIALAREGKVTPGLREFASVLENQLQPILDNGRFVAKYDEMGEVRIKGAWKAPEGPDVNRYFVGHKGSPLAGRWLGHVPDAKLAQRRSQLRRKGLGKKPTRAQEQAAIDEVATLADLQQSFPTVAHNAKGLMDSFELPAHDVLRNLKRARKGPIKFLTRAKNVETGVAPGRKRLSAEESKRWELAAADFNPVPEQRFDLKALDLAEREEMFRIEEALELRRTGQAKHEKRTKLPDDVEPVAPRTPQQIEQVLETDLGEARQALDGVTDGIGHTIAQVMHAGLELRRASSTGFVSPALAEYAIGSLNRFSQYADEMMLSALGKDSRNAFKFLKARQAEITEEAVRHGIMAIGSPIAYVGHILSAADTQIVDELLGIPAVKEALDAAAPQASSVHARTASNMSLEELNDVTNILRDQHPEIADKLKSLAADNGLKLGKYSTNPVSIMMTRLAQAKDRDTAVRYFEDSLDALQESETMLAGQITHRVMKNGQRVKLGETLKAKTKGSAKGTEVEMQLSTSPIETEMSGVILKDHQGKEHFILKSVFQDHMVGIRLGKREKAVVPGFETEAVNPTANQFAVRMQRGKIGKGDILDNPAMFDEVLDDMVDEHIILGDQQTVMGMSNALASQFQHGHAITAAFDSAHIAIKKSQTTWKLPFHLFNLKGASLQMSAVGIAPQNITMAYIDMLRFMSNKREVVETASRAQLYAGHKSGSRLGLVSRAARRLGKKGETPFKRSDEAMEHFGLTAEDFQFHFDGQVEDISETFQLWGDGEMFGTHISSGMRGTGKVSTKMERLRRLNLDSSKLGRFKEQLYEVGQDTLEASEIAARVMGYWAARRQGIPGDQAVDLVKRAMVDYSRVTNFEKNIMKRLFSFYTFPRHYLPVAYKHYSENPAAFSRAAHLIQQADQDRDGIFEEYGRIRVGPSDYTLDITRLSPNLEAVKLIEAAGEIVLNGASRLSEVTGGRGLEAARQEQLSAGTSQPFQVGSLQTAAFYAFDGQDDTSALQEMSDAFWVSRFAFDPGNPLAEESTFSKLVSQVGTGLKKKNPEAMRKALEYRYNRLIRDMERRAELTTDLDYRRELREEARRLTELAKEQASRID